MRFFMDARKDKDIFKWMVYEHESPSGKVYVGITHYQNPNIRWQNGKGYRKCPFFYPAILKYGWDNIVHRVLAKNLSRKDAGKLERSLIRKYKDLNLSYNSADGGDGPQGRMSDEARKHMSSANRSHEPEVRAKISQTLKENHPEPWNKGKTGVYSEETRQKMGAGMRGKVGPNKGKKRPPVSQETRKKLSESHKGKNTWSKGSIRGPYSEEHREKISKALKGKRKGIPLGERPENVKKQISESRKGQKWVCKPWEQPKQIPQNEIQIYIDKGWQLGKLIRMDDKYYKWDGKIKTWHPYTPKTPI